MMWLTFDQVALGYGMGTDVLRDVTLRVGPGLWGVLGANGSGKSSLLRAAAGILRPRRGRIRLGEVDLWDDPSRYRSHLGFMPQEVLSFPPMSAGAYLRYLGQLKGIRPAYLDPRATDLLTRFELPDWNLSRYSTGMKQQLLLAAALLNDPDLLVLDEPMAGLDPWNKVQTRTLLGDLARDRIILISTHIPEEIGGSVDGWIRVATQGVTSDA